MPTHFPRPAIAAATMALLVAGCAQNGHHADDGHAHHADHAGHAHHAHDTQRAPPGSASGTMQQQMHEGMRQMQAMPLSGNVDKDFVRMMRLHHQQGVDMARVELDKGASPEVKAMARRIVEQQEAEIAQFDEWLRRNP